MVPVSSGTIYAFYWPRSGCAEGLILERLKSDDRHGHIFLTVRTGQLHQVFCGSLCEGEIT